MGASRVDMRSLTPAERQAKREVVIRLRDSGLSYEDIARETGLSRTGVFDICKRFATAGSASLTDRTAGRRPGTGRQLSPAQEADLLTQLCTRSPDQLGLSAPLWSPAVFAELVAERCHVALPARTVSLYLTRWGFIAPQPSWPAQGLTSGTDGAAEALWIARSRINLTSLAGGACDILHAVTRRKTWRWQAQARAITAQDLQTFLALLLAEGGDKALHLHSTPDLPWTAPDLQRWWSVHRARLKGPSLPGRAVAGEDVSPATAPAAMAPIAAAQPRKGLGGSTIKDVARRAGVTATTVSNVLRERPGVGPAVRELVLQAIEAEGYRPNLAARALAERRAPALALMLTSITNPFYPEFALATHLAAQAHRRFLLVCNTNYEVDGGTRFLGEVAGTLAEGIVVANHTVLPIEELQAVAAKGVPVVINIWEHPDESPGIPCVSFDSRHAGRVATSHLVELGHRRIGAVIANPIDSIHRGRYWGHRSALDAAGIAHNPSHERFCDDSIDSGLDAATELLQAHPEITALFVSNDLPALGVLNAVAEMGLRVPHDISVVSITNIMLTQHTRPPLTTVAIPTAEFAEAGIRLVLRLIEDPTHAECHVEVSKPKLVVRQSTAPPRS